MAAIEEELSAAVHEQESRMFFQIKVKRLELERSVKATHRNLKRSFFPWLETNRPQNLITVPIIYAMILPIPVFDMCVTIYQYTFFPIYPIPRVRRSG